MIMNRVSVVMLYGRVIVSHERHVLSNTIHGRGNCYIVRIPKGNHYLFYCPEITHVDTSVIMMPLCNEFDIVHKKQRKYPTTHELHIA